MGIERIVGNAYAQSCLDGCEARNVLDGNAETCWKAAPYYQWWMMDCGSDHQIASVAFQTGMPEGAFCRYAIDYSLDRINWKELYEKIDNSVEPEGGFVHEADVSARYIRITVTYCSTGETCMLRGVTVMGQPLQETQQQQGSLVDMRVRAATCDSFCGFEKVETEELESGWKDTMLLSGQGNSWLCFKQVNLDDLNEKQLHGMYFLPEKDRTLQLHVEVRLDTPDGTLIGQMQVTRQYTPWLQFSCDLQQGSYGLRDLYFCLTQIDAPQQLGVLWLHIKNKPVLGSTIVDHADEAVEDEGPLQVYFGNMHCHTGFTDGSKTPEFAYDYARYQAGLDMLGIAEHSNLFDDTFDANASRKWRDLKRIAEEKTEDGKFLAVMGSETTWYNQFGHMNIYGADFFLNPYEVKYNDTACYYETLKKFPRVINQWNHPWSCGNRHLDMFEPYDPELDKIMYTMELTSIEVPEEKCMDYYIHALDLGWHISPVGNQDNHRPNWGTETDVRTGVLMHKLTKADFYDAYRKHRTYYTSSKKLRIIYHANGMLMGSIIPNADNVEFAIQIQNEAGDAPLEYVEIRGFHGEVMARQDLSGHGAEVRICVTEPSPYYFLKIRQTDGKLAVTAPVWVEE